MIYPSKGILILEQQCLQPCRKMFLRQIFLCWIMQPLFYSIAPQGNDLVLVIKPTNFLD